MADEHYHFNRDDVLPSFWANRIQQLLSGLATGLRVEQKDATTVRVPAGAGDDVAALTIDGKWRFVEAPLELAHPGGAAGTYVLWATTGANAIVANPDPFTDNTNYAFALAMTAGADPAGAGIVHVRPLADVAWDGAAITQVVPRRSIQGTLAPIEFAFGRTYTLSGPVTRTDNLPSTDPQWTMGFRVPILAPKQEVFLFSALGELQGGGTATVKVRAKKWGVAETDIGVPWAGLLFGANEEEHLPTAYQLADRERVRPDVTAVGNAAAGGHPAGNPSNLSVTLGFRYRILLG